MTENARAKERLEQIQRLVPQNSNNINTNTPAEIPTSWPPLPPQAAYLVLNNPSHRNALSLTVLRSLRAQLHAFNRSPSDGQVRLLPPFTPSLLSALEEAASDLTSASGREYSWLLHLDEWTKHRAGLPKVIVLRSAAGPVFCSGHDLRELRAQSYHEVKETFALCAEVMSLIRRSPAPVVGAIHGFATAAGAQLALTTDLPVAAAGTRFRLPGASMGLPCSSPAAGVVRRVGPAATFRMLALAEPVRVEDLPAGTVDVVSVDGDPDVDAVAVANAGSAFERRVAQVVEQLAERTAGQPAALAKWAYWTQLALRGQEADGRGGDGYEDAVRWTGRVMALHSIAVDAKEGIDAFFEKREPRWRT